ncbi:uncharacterized protein BDR25DRAFT_230632, partial [Lindgomyces ingoldianus]
PVTEVQELTGQVLEKLYEMHKNGFAHRNLKPALPDVWWVKLADFGISKRAADGNGS